MLERIASGTSLIIDFGGGIKTSEDLKIAFDSGAAMVTGGSIAATSPELFLGWLGQYGPDRIILGADHRKGKILVSGWTEDAETDLFPFLEYYTDKGIKQVICTDIDVTACLQGHRQTPMQLSWNVFRESGPDCQRWGRSMRIWKHLKRIGIPAVIVGKAIYEGRISDVEIKLFLNRVKDVAKRIIPCLDIRDGKTVKGINFLDVQDVGDPVELGAKYAADGADELVYLDITATFEERKLFADLVKRIARTSQYSFYRWRRDQ